MYIIKCEKCGKDRSMKLKPRPSYLRNHPHCRKCIWEEASLKISKANKGKIKILSKQDLIDLGAM